MLHAMELHVTSQEAAATLEDLLDRVSGGDTTVVIERDGRPVVKLIPVGQAPRQVGKLLTAGDIAAIDAAIRVGRELNDGWAEAVEEAIRLGNQPMSLEDPWDR
jgi:prevent-host-death family protein